MRKKAAARSSSGSPLADPSGRGVTAEMLPDTMTEKEKDDYIADTAEREKKSKWMMTFIVPLLLALLIDLLDMYVLKNLSL